MRKILLLAAAGALASGALAHDTQTAFESRGACEAALAQINNEDADFLLSIGEFDKRGDALRWFHAVFACEERDGAWYITFVGGA